MLDLSTAKKQFWHHSVSSYYARNVSTRDYYNKHFLADYQKYDVEHVYDAVPSYSTFCRWLKKIPISSTCNSIGSSSESVTPPEQLSSEQPTMVQAENESKQFSETECFAVSLIMASKLSCLSSANPLEKQTLFPLIQIELATKLSELSAIYHLPKRDFDWQELYCSQGSFSSIADLFDKSLALLEKYTAASCIKVEELDVVATSVSVHDQGGAFASEIPALDRAPMSHLQDDFMHQKVNIIPPSAITPEILALLSGDDDCSDDPDTSNITKDDCSQEYCFDMNSMWFR